MHYLLWSSTVYHDVYISLYLSFRSALNNGQIQVNLFLLQKYLISITDSLTNLSPESTCHAGLASPAPQPLAVIETSQMWWKWMEPFQHLYHRYPADHASQSSSAPPAKGHPMVSCILSLLDEGRTVGRKQMLAFLTAFLKYYFNGISIWNINTRWKTVLYHIYELYM